MKVETYSLDLDLFKSIGFKSFSIDTHEKYYIGEHKLPEYENAFIKVWVFCLPAQCWTFEIHTCEEMIFIMTTGSGMMSDFWLTAMSIAEGMIVIKQKE